MNGHWTDDDFIARLYGVGPAESHLDDCPDCRARQAMFQARRKQLTRTEVELDGKRLREQRMAVFARLGVDARPAWRKTAPGLAAAAVLVAGILLVRPSGAPVVLGARHIAVVENPSADAQFFQDIAALDDSPEPQAAIVASGLFQQQ